MRQRRSIIGLAFALIAGAGSCVATPLPQPPSIELELDVEKVTVESTDGEPVVIVGQQNALSIGGIGLRVTPGPTDSDPILEIGNATAADDGSFTVIVISPLENTYFFERIDGDTDEFFAAITVDAAGNVSETDPGPDGDGDGSPDEIDCAPTDPDLVGQRCP